MSVRFLSKYVLQSFNIFITFHWFKSLNVFIFYFDIAKLNAFFASLHNSIQSNQIYFDFKLIFLLFFFCIFIVQCHCIGSSPFCLSSQLFAPLRFVFALRFYGLSCYADIFCLLQIQTKTGSSSNNKSCYINSNNNSNIRNTNNNIAWYINRLFHIKDIKIYARVKCTLNLIYMDLSCVFSVFLCICVSVSLFDCVCENECHKALLRLFTQ